MQMSQLDCNVNHQKTEYMLYNQAEVDSVTLGGKKLKQVDDLEYLGSWIASSKMDREIRMGLAWKALDKMDKLWKYNLHGPLKIQFFRVTVESVLLYVQRAGHLQMP